MNANKFVRAGIAIAMSPAMSLQGFSASAPTVGSGNVKHVLILSIDGMHAVDFYNCSHGVFGVNNGTPYCPNLAALSQTGINYVNTTSSKPSDSYPGIAAIVSGGTPKSTGLYYDVAFDRTLAGPAKTTGTGLAASTCTPNVAPINGTTTDNDQGIDFDDRKLNGGAPGAAPTEGGIASIDPGKLSRDPMNGCKPVWPWNFIRVNTIFGVVHAAGGYTAWIDKHPSYATVGGPGGNGLNDYFSPEVSSTPIALPGVTTALGDSCATVRDTAAGAWNGSFEDIQCYDQLKVNALLNQIAGKTHNGAAAQVPAVFGMNFQSVYIGQSVNESGVGAGGYQNSAATPSALLLTQFKYVDAAIGQIVEGLKNAGIYKDTLVIVTAKHGAAPIDPARYIANGSNTPATLLGTVIPFSESPLTAGGIGATEDDVSVLWLKKGQSVTVAVQLLESNASAIGLGEILYGGSLRANYGVGGYNAVEDPRTPDIIVTPNLGMTYAGSPSQIEDHGGFSHDDTNVILLVANPSFASQTVSDATATTQVAPTVLTALGLDPTLLDAVKIEGTQTLPGITTQLQSVE
jgi:hypothetical protein